MIDLRLGDCRDVLRTLDDDSIDAIVTDPPYGLAFMGKRWDYDVPSVEVWQECLRVLKPGGHLLAFAGTRTQHRMCVRIEDAGFEIRDMIAWVYGSGFPKSLDVSKAIDRVAGALGVQSHGFNTAGGKESFAAQNKSFRSDYGYRFEPATDAARQWQGWGTALKPALEPITVARKPLSGTVADNVMRYGTGAINVDGCRVTSTGESKQRIGEASQNARYTDKGSTNFAAKPGIRGGDPAGRWPANLIHDGSDEVVGLFPDTASGSRKAGRHVIAGGHGRYGKFAEGELPEIVGDSGSAARFFYCAKASKRDRDEGNIHPTVKPTDLMRYLCRLVTPPGGVVLDPFMGSGSTGKAAVLEGFDFVGIERDPDYVKIAMSRIAHVAPEKEAEDEADDQLALFP